MTGKLAHAQIYDWKIERIEIQTALLIEVWPRVLERDPAKLGWKDILKTIAWKDEGEYLLHCNRIGGPRLPRGRRRP
jgi:hypothetical protein